MGTVKKKQKLNTQHELYAIASYRIWKCLKNSTEEQRNDLFTIIISIIIISTIVLGSVYYAIHYTAVGCGVLAKVAGVDGKEYYCQPVILGEIPVVGGTCPNEYYHYGPNDCVWTTHYEIRVREKWSVNVFVIMIVQMIFGKNDVGVLVNGESSQNAIKPKKTLSPTEEALQELYEEWRKEKWKIRNVMCVIGGLPKQDTVDAI